MTRLIDAHQHFWSLGTPGHQWPTVCEAAIYSDFGPADLAIEVGDRALSGTVLVQSQPTDADTDWLLALARDQDRVLAVVGWIDLASPDAPAQIERLAAEPKLKGIRPMLQAIDDTDWLLATAIAPALDAMQTCGLRLDALVQPRHLPMLARLAEDRPTLSIVIDHAAKPFAAKQVIEPWATEIEALAGLGVYCKLSGLRTEQAPGQSVNALTPYVDHLVTCFRDRLMWGSDWPVVRLSGDCWQQWLDDATRLASQAGADLPQLLAGAARDFYGVAVELEAPFQPDHDRGHDCRSQLGKWPAGAAAVMERANIEPEKP